MELRDVQFWFISVVWIKQLCSQVSLLAFFFNHLKEIEKMRISYFVAKWLLVGLLCCSYKKSNYQIFQLCLTLTCLDWFELVFCLSVVKIYVCALISYQSEFYNFIFLFYLSVFEIPKLIDFYWLGLCFNAHLKSCMFHFVACEKEKKKGILIMHLIMIMNFSCNCKFINILIRC